MVPGTGPRVRRGPFRQSPARQIGLAGIVALGAVVAAAPAARAQGSGNGFLFQAPVGSFALRAGYAHASAGSDLFTFVTNQLTVNRSNFSGPTVAADLAFRLAPRIDLVLGAGYAGTSTSSEYRQLVDQKNQPIQQTTSFQRVPLTASLRAYLMPRGRSIGHFAWVPARFAPYVGVGAGAVWYRFRQQGDFVDPSTNAVFTGDFTSSRWAPAAQGMVGADYSLTPRLALTGQAAYLWSKGTLDQTSFSGFHKLDLSGFTTTLGLAVRF